MGLIFSRKKKKSTKETLEDLEKDIRKIEDFRQHTEQKQKRTIGKLLLYGIPLYGLFVLAIYFRELPSSFYGKACIVSLVLCLPVLFFFLRRTLTWYFRRQIRQNEEKLSELYVKKNKILEDVMETETYKVAKEILEKFAPDRLRNKSSSNGNQENSVIQNYSRMQGTPQQGSELRKRIVPVPGTAPRQSPPQSVPRPQVIQRSTPYGPEVGRGMPPQMHNPFPANAQQGFGRGGMILPPPGPPMPRPIPPYERSFVDRMIEYLIGDGPNKRYALICRQCESHNGMALQEEFEYLAFRCCYCYYWNPARKQRPHAPRLPVQAPTPPGGRREKEEGGDESVTDEDGSEETSSEAPSGDHRDLPDGNARDSEEDACSDSGDAASKEESSHRESLPAAEDISEANGQELSGSEATPASSSSVSPSTEEGSGGHPPLIEMENAASGESGGSSGSPVIEEQVMEELIPSIPTKQD